MNYVTFGFISLIGILLLYTGLRLTGAINGNFQTSSELRNQYAQRIRLLPMYKILALVGIDQDRLLYQMPVAEIEAGIRNSEACSISTECLNKLKTKSNQDFSYCVNDDFYDKVQKIPA